MGQLALGLRSLAIRLAVFVVMAALLAWALGGTLLPRAESAEYDAVEAAGRSWYWRLDVGGRRVPEFDPLGVQWTLMVRDSGGRARPALEQGWVDVTGPVATPDRVWFAGREDSDPGTPWRLHEVRPAPADARDHQHRDLGPLSGRLEAELQLARLASGRPALTPAEVRELLGRIAGPAATRDLIGDPPGSGSGSAPGTADAPDTPDE